MSYGKELILDIHDCDPKALNLGTVQKFMSALCRAIDMEPVKLYYWEAHEHTEPDNVRGMSACQFIRTSSVTIHTLDANCRVYLNIFSCKDFDNHDALRVTAFAFGGTLMQMTEVIRD